MTEKIQAQPFNLSAYSSAQSKLMRLAVAGRATALLEPTPPLLRAARPQRIERSLLDFSRNLDENALDIADKIEATLGELRQELPATITLQLYDVRADQIRDRIRVLVENRVAGMTMVAVTLFLFLNVWAAFWIELRLPV